jgi:hypothetical protein
MHMGTGADGGSVSNTLSQVRLDDDGTECTALNRVLKVSMALLPTQKVGAWPGI